MRNDQILLAPRDRCIGELPRRAGCAFQMSLDATARSLGVPLESATMAGKQIKEVKLRTVFGLDKAIKVKANFAVYPAGHAKGSPVEAFRARVYGQAARG
ncbi:MAG: hypothetical protein J0M00_02210 [Burkholderiales bacterium]|nr:hypothetical protein [Burkholderiales bacterium]